MALELRLGDLIFMDKETAHPEDVKFGHIVTITTPKEQKQQGDNAEEDKGEEKEEEPNTREVMRYSMEAALYARSRQQEQSSSKKLEDLWAYCRRRRPDFATRYAVYRHFRNKGYNVQSGLLYGSHFVLYEGTAAEYHSRFCVFICFSTTPPPSWHHLQTLTRLMPSVCKSLLVCSVEWAAGAGDQECARFDQLSQATVLELRVASMRFKHMDAMGTPMGPSALVGNSKVGLKPRAEKSLKKRKRGSPAVVEAAAPVPAATATAVATAPSAVLRGEALVEGGEGCTERDGGETSHKPMQEG